MMVSSSPKAAKKRAGGVAPEEKVSLIDSEGQPSQPEPSPSSQDARATASSSATGGLLPSWLSGAVSSRFASAPPSSPSKNASAKNKMKMGVTDVEMVSLLDSDGQPTPGPPSVITTITASSGTTSNGKLTSATLRKGPPVKKKKRRRKKKPAAFTKEWVVESIVEFRREWSCGRIIRYLGLMMASATVTSLILRRENRMLHWQEHEHLLFPQAKRDHRCFTLDSHNHSRCNCADPHIGIPQTISSTTTGDKSPKILPPWQEQHDRMVRDAILAPKELDMVMLGDSIIERWNGTRSMGSEVIPEMRNPFIRRFTKAGGGSFEGLALGCAGDTGPNLLWHLQNGVLEPLDPKVWFILIGSNDLFESRCTDRFVFANILNVLQELHMHRPDAQFIIHGILPRKDQRKNTTQYLGEYWRMSQQVNAMLKKFCKNYDNLHYMQGGKSFMKDNDKQRGRQQIDANLMADGVHPTRHGLVNWGKLIVAKLNQTLIYAEEQAAEKAKKEAKRNKRKWFRNRAGS